MCGPMPLFLLDAAQRGTGKTLLNDLVHTIWTGEPAPLSDLPLNAEEQRKQLTTHLIRGPASVVFDNISLLQGNAIDRAVTGHTWTDRILGKNEDVTVPIRTIFSATGNNVTLGGDMVRRVLLIRLESQEENPSQRADFRRDESELRLWVQDHRADLVSACIAIIQHGLAHGTPGAIKMGGFDRFVRTASTILNGIGVAGFYENMPQTFAREDSRQSGWKAIVWEWYERHGTDLVKPGDIAKIIEGEPDCEIILEGDTIRARDTAAGMLLKRKVGTIYAYDELKLRVDQVSTSKGHRRYRVTVLPHIPPEPGPEDEPGPTSDGGDGQHSASQSDARPSQPSQPRDFHAQPAHAHTRAHARGNESELPRSARSARSAHSDAAPSASGAAAPPDAAQGAAPAADGAAPDPAPPEPEHDAALIAACGPMTDDTRAKIAQARQTWRSSEAAFSQLCRGIGWDMADAIRAWVEAEKLSRAAQAREREGGAT
jgi:hypothetical protein